MPATLTVPLAGFALCAAMLAIFLRTPLVRLYGDAPDDRKVHLHVVPRFGGLAMVVTFLILAVLAPWIPGYENFIVARRLLPSLALAGFFLLVSGTWDDIRPVNFKVKFILQFALASFLVLVLRNRFETVALLGHQFPLGGLGSFASVFWLVGLMNAFNIIDGIDGLAAGVALCGFTAMALVAQAGGHAGLILVCLGMMGIVAGFLLFNFSAQNKVFLGDTGAQFLGVALGLMAMQTQSMPHVGRSPLVPVLIVGYPILDVGVAMTRRFLASRIKNLADRSLRMFEADSEHLHHRLVYLGLSHVQATFLLLTLAASLSASAYVVARTGWVGTLLILLYLIMAFTLILNAMGFLGRNRWITEKGLQKLAAVPFILEGSIPAEQNPKTNGHVAA